MNEPLASSWLIEAARRGERVAVSGHRQLSLTDSDHVWWIESGSVELFSERTNLGSLPRGALLCGVPALHASPSTSLFITGRSGTCLRRLDRQQLENWSTDPALMRDLVISMMPWIEILFEWAARATGGIGAARELQMDEEGSKLSSATLPLLAARLSRGDLLPLLDWLAVDALLAVEQVQAMEEETALDQRGVRLNQRTQTELRAWKQLQDAGDLRSTLGPPLGSDAADLLFQTLKTVAEASGISLREPPAVSGRNFHEEAARIAEYSRVRLRKVALRGDWWREDHGPLLVQRKDGAPLALRPAPRGKGYEAIDRATARRWRLSPEEAEELSVFAFMLYRPLPAEKISRLSQLLRFAFAGLFRDASVLVVAGFGVGILGSVIPFLFGWLIDQAVTAGDHDLLFQCALGILVVSLAAPAIKVFENYMALRLECRSDLALQAALWDRLLSLPARFFRQFQPGDLADRMSGILRIRSLVAKSGRGAILGLVSSSCYLGLMFLYSPKLAMVGLGITIVLMSVSLFLAWGQFRWQRQLAEYEGKVSAMLFQLLSGISKIRIAGAESYAFFSWSTVFAQQLQATVRAGRWQNRSMVFQAIIPPLAPLALFLAAAPAEDASGGLSTGQFVAFFSAFGLLTTALLNVCEMVPRFAEALPIYQRLRPILANAPEVDPLKHDPGRLNGEIRLSKVSFRYDPDGGPWILRDIDLDIRPGQFVALVGPSGSGKSSLLRLLLGFEKPESGTISYDGQDLATLDLRSVRRQIGVVLQTTKPFAADILENVVGTSSRSLQEAMDAAQQAGFDHDIAAMPMGWHTFVGEEGGNLSGGQRQRLMIARALINKPPIIFMDEATSALDNRTQHTVSESLNRLKATRVVVAHRLSTIRNADRIVVLVGGRIVEQGTFDELMKEGGEFAKLAQRQLLETPEGDETSQGLLIPFPDAAESREPETRLDQIHAARGSNLAEDHPALE